MTHVLPFVVLAMLIVGWALWERHKDPYLLLKATPEWQRMAESMRQLAHILSIEFTPALRDAAKAMGDLSEAWAKATKETS